MDNGIYILAAVVVGLLLILAIIRLAMWLQAFMAELRYVNKEIDRTAGAEWEHWRKRKKRLLLSLIPFVRY